MTLSIVQSKLITGASSGSFNSPTSAGNDVLLLIGGSNLGSGSTPSVSGCTLGGSADNFGALGANATIADNSSLFGAIVTGWLDSNAASGQTAISVSLTNATCDFIWALEISGLGPNPPLDVNASTDRNSGGGVTSWSSGTTGTSGTATELVLGIVCAGHAVPPTATITGPGSPYTNSSSYNNSGGYIYIAGYRITSSTGTFTYAGSVSSAAFYAALCFSLRPSHGGTSQLSGSGVLSAANTVVGSASLSGSGVITETVLLGQPATTLVGVGSLTVRRELATSLAGFGSLIATGESGEFSSLVGVGSLVAEETSGGSVLTGVGLLTSGTIVLSLELTLSGTGQFSLASTILRSIVLSGVGTFTSLAGYQQLVLQLFSYTPGGPGADLTVSGLTLLPTNRYGVAFANNYGNVVLLVYNTTSGNAEITPFIVREIENQRPTSPSYILAPGAFQAFGPFPVNDYTLSSGEMLVNISANSGVYTAAFQLKRAVLAYGSLTYSQFGSRRYRLNAIDSREVEVSTPGEAYPGTFTPGD